MEPMEFVFQSPLPDSQTNNSDSQASDNSRTSSKIDNIIKNNYAALCTSTESSQQTGSGYDFSSQDAGSVAIPGPSQNDSASADVAATLLESPLPEYSDESQSGISAVDFQGDIDMDIDQSQQSDISQDSIPPVSVGPPLSFQAGMTYGSGESSTLLPSQSVPPSPEEVPTVPTSPLSTRLHGSSAELESEPGLQGNVEGGGTEEVGGRNYCGTCKKHFARPFTLKRHLKTRKHHLQSLKVKRRTRVISRRQRCTPPSSPMRNLTGFATTTVL